MFFPPAVPTGLQAVFLRVGQSPFVDLIWSPDTEADLAGYNVYRREENGEPAKLTSEPVKAPASRDRNEQSGKQYFYSVSAVDVRGNESARSEEASERVPRSGKLRWLTAAAQSVACIRVVRGAFFRALCLYKSI